MGLLPLVISLQSRVCPSDASRGSGTACRPYPSFRLPGWHRDSAGFHLDDLRKFFENSDGGQDYQGIGITRIKTMDTVGCGYEFSTGSLFYTYNGARLPSAFIAYVPRQNYDVFATIGVAGECEFKVNFGGDIFRWKEGNEWAWRVEGHIGRLGTMYGGLDEELPSYNEVRRMQWISKFSSRKSLDLYFVSTSLFT